jgi:hypothetical protein
MSTPVVLNPLTVVADGYGRTVGVTTDERFKVDILTTEIAEPHAPTHIAGGSDVIDADQLVIDYGPNNYTNTNSPSEVTADDQLTGHLAGIDDALGDIDNNLDVTNQQVTNIQVSLDGYATISHAPTHILGASDEIDGDQLDIDFTPTNYTPNISPLEVYNADHLSAHLAGIDGAIGNLEVDINQVEVDINQVINEILIALDGYDLESALSVLQDQVTHIQNELDGYALVVDLDAATTRIDSLEEQTTNIQNALDGYCTVDECATVSGQVTNIQNSLDGYATTSHASTHITGGSDEIDGDQLDIDFTPTNYTPDISPAEVTNLDHLSAHLQGINNALGNIEDSIGISNQDIDFILEALDGYALQVDLEALQAVTTIIQNSLDGYATVSHAPTHILGGSDEIDGDQLDIDFSPSNYTPDTSPSEVSNADHLSAHLKGIDNALMSMSTEYGEDYQYESSEGTSITTTTTYRTKVSLTTGLLTGTYRVAWTAVAFGEDDELHRYRLRDDTNNVTLSEVGFEPEEENNKMHVGAFREIDFSNESRTFKIQWRSGSYGDRAKIKQARIEFWKVA